MRHIVFDTETTGLSPREGHRLVEIGAVEMLSGSLTGQTFHRYIDPERDMPIEAYRVHRISAEMLAGKPKFAEVAEAFLDFVGDAALVAHNAPFDMGFLNFELERCGQRAWGGEVIDTVQMARRKFPGSPASLDALCARFGIDTSQRDAEGHGAILDAKLLAEVWIELTGGRQAGLSFGAARAAGADAGGRGAGRGHGETPQRGAPRPALVTEIERAAHAAFVGEMPNAIWGRRS